MALHKEPYGLVYNDDGSLCVTLRKDDTPFEGVTSFAVEEGTENLVCEALRYQSSTSAYGTCTKGATAGKTYALSGRVKVDADGHWFRIYLYKSGWGWSDYLEWNKTQYETKAKVITLPNDGGTYYMSFFAGPRNSGCTAYIDWLQVEQKPFATSFVDGSRPIGSLWLPVDLTAMDNSVVAFWFKMYYANTKHRLDIADWKDSSNWNYNYSIRYDAFDNGTNAWYIAVKKRANNEAPPVLYTTTTKDLTDGWHFAVFVHDETTGETKAYLDGEKMIDGTFYFYKDKGRNKMNVGMPFGSEWSGEDSGAALISDLYIGKAKDSSGNLIWTDDFVRYVYNLKRPFIIE